MSGRTIHNTSAEQLLADASRTSLSADLDGHILAERRKAGELYFDLLRRAHAPKPGDAAKVLECLRVLERGRDQIDADREMVVALDAAIDLAKECDTRGAAARDAHAAWTEFEQWAAAAMEKLQREIASKKEAIESRWLRASGASDEAHTAQRNIDFHRKGLAAIVLGTTRQEIIFAERDAAQREHNRRVHQAAEDRKALAATPPEGRPTKFPGDEDDA